MTTQQRRVLALFMVTLPLISASLLVHRLRIGDYDVKLMLWNGRSIRFRVADGEVMRDDVYIPVILDRHGNFERYGCYRWPRITLDDGQFITMEKHEQIR